MNENRTELPCDREMPKPLVRMPWALQVVALLFTLIGVAGFFIGLGMPHDSGLWFINVDAPSRTSE